MLVCQQVASCCTTASESSYTTTLGTSPPPTSQRAARFPSARGGSARRWRPRWVPAERGVLLPRGGRGAGSHGCCAALGL